MFFHVSSLCMDVGPVLWLRQPQSPRAIGASKGCGVRPAVPLLRSKVKKHQQTTTDSFKRLFDAPLESESFIWSTVLSELEEYRIWFAVLGCFRLFYNPQSLPSMETHALVLTQLYYADYAYITRRFRLVCGTASWKMHLCMERRNEEGIGVVKSGEMAQFLMDYDYALTMLGPR